MIDIQADAHISQKQSISNDVILIKSGNDTVEYRYAFMRISNPYKYTRITRNAFRFQTIYIDDRGVGYLNIVLYAPACMYGGVENVENFYCRTQKRKKMFIFHLNYDF